MLADPGQLNGMNGGVLAAIFAVYFVFIIIAVVIIIIPFWFILKKAGFSPWLALVNIVPFGTLILLYILAFGDWKVVAALQAAWPQQFPPQPPYPPQA